MILIMKLAKSQHHVIDLNIVKFIALAYHSWSKHLSLLALIVIPILVAVFHPLDIALCNMIFTTGAPTVIITQHLLHKFVLQRHKLF